MPAYIVFNYDVTDHDKIGAYLEQAPAIVANGGSVLAMDPASVAVEGSPGHQTVLVEFESKAAALAAYESDAYQAAIGLRTAATENSRVLIIDGVA